MLVTKKFAAGIVVLAFAVFGALLLTDPAWARPTCNSCNFNFGACIGNCTTPQCEDNCWGWYDICLAACWGASPEPACIANCHFSGCEVELLNGVEVWYCVR